jgi:hypothetical protein
VVVDAERRGRVALRVEVDDQHAQTADGERGGEVHRGGGLAHAALLVRHDHDPDLVGLRHGSGTPAHGHERDSSLTCDGRVHVGQ